MKVLKDRLFTSIVLSGVSVGAGMFVLRNEYPVVSLVLFGVWLVVAVLAGYVLLKKYRHDSGDGIRGWE